MNHIFQSLNKALQKKSYDQNMIARLLLNELANLLGYPHTLQGYLKRRTLSVYSTDQTITIALFTQKEKYLTALNEKLASLGYTITIKDVRTTVQRETSVSDVE